MGHSSSNYWLSEWRALLAILCTTACQFATCWQPKQPLTEPPAVSVRASIGGNATLPCDFADERFSRMDSLRVIWLRNTTPLAFNRVSLREKRLSIAEPEDGPWGRLRYDLVVRDLRRSDQGDYSCIANYLGQYYPRRVALLIKVPPRIIDASSSPTKMIVVEGESLVLRCDAEGYPQPTISWFKRLRQLSFTGNLEHRTIALGSGQRYSMSNASRQCEGVFVCQASNGEKPTDSREIDVIVHYRPRVSVVNEQISQSRGRSTMVMCAVSGLPMPDFYWEHWGRRFRPTAAAAASGAAVSGSQESCWRRRHCVHVATVDGARGLVQMDLLVHNLTASDFGVYYCVARSSLGEDRQAVHVLELGVQREPALAAPIPPVGEAAAASLPDKVSGNIGNDEASGPNNNKAEALEGEQRNKHSSVSLVTSSASGGASPSVSLSSAVAAASLAVAMAQLRLR